MTQSIDVRLAFLRSVVEKDLQDFVTRMRLVETCFEAGRGDEGVGEFIALVQATPNFPQVHYEALGQTSRAVPADQICLAFDRVSQARPKDALAWYGVGLALQLLLDQDGAADAFKKGMFTSPPPLHKALLSYNLGVALMDFPMQAEMFFSDAVQFNPAMAEPHYSLGTLALGKDHRQAIHHFREFVRLAPPHLQGFVQQALWQISNLE